MQIRQCSILPLLRRPAVAISPAPMHRVSPASRPLCSFMAASAPPRWWPPALARRGSPLTEPPDPPFRRVFRFPNGLRNLASTSGVKHEELGKPDRCRLIPSTSGEADGRRTSADAIYGDEDARRTAMETTDGKQIFEVADGEKDAREVTEDVILLCGDGPPSGDIDDEEYEHLEAEQITWNHHPDYPDGDVRPMYTFPLSRHRDGSIYRATYRWKEEYRIADRNEIK